MCVCVCVCVCITKDDHGRLVLRSVIFMKELLEKVMQGSRSNGPANNAMFLLPPRFITIPRVRGVNGHEVHELVDRVRDGSQGPEDHEACTKLSEDCRWIVVTVAHCADCDDSKVEGIVKVEAGRKEETVTLAEQEENTLIREGVVLRAEHLFRSQTGDSYTGSTRDLLLNKKRPTIRGKETWSCPTILAGCPSG